MIEKMTKKKALEIVSEFQWIVGRNFIPPFENKKITSVEYEKKYDGSYRVVVKVAIIKKDDPNLMGLQDPKCELFRYLKFKGITHDLLKYSDIDK
jgi:hypothetical protein